MLKYEKLITKQFKVVSQHGDEFLCVCPFHHDTGRPNLYANGVKGLYLCHACGAKGKVAGDVPEDWKGLLSRLSPDDVVDEQVVYDTAWLRQYDFPTDFWTERGFSDGTIRRFELGYDPLRDEAIIPTRDHHGDLIGVIRRRLDPGDGPRYLYPKGFPLSRILFGANLLGANHRKVAIVEGSLDTVACWNAKVPAVGLLGANLTKTQCRLLYELDIEHLVVMTDNDTAGRLAVEHILDEVRGMVVSIGAYRPYWAAKDPGDLKPQQIKKMFHSARRWNFRI